MSLFRKLRPDQSVARSRAKSHVSVGAGTLSRTLSRTGLILKKQLWIWPLIAVVILAGVGFSVRVAIERTMKANLESQLSTLLKVETAMLENWARSQVSNAETLANDTRVRTHVYELLRAANDDSAPAGSPPAGTADDVARELRRMLGPSLAAHDYHGYLVANRNREILACSDGELVGRKGVKEYEEFLARVFDGETVVSPPFLSVASVESESGERRDHAPTMMVCAPVRDESFQVVAALALRIKPEREFTRIMQLGQIGKSGETYAFNADGLMVSNSRFDEDLILLGVLPDEPGSRSILRLPVRDPGQDITALGRPKVRRSDMPLTKMATAAVAGQAGVDVGGYRDYRGVPVVGAWTWLPKLKIGVATELDYAEAFQPIQILRTAFFSMLGLLTVAAIAIFIFTVIVARLRREAQKAAIEAKELGQYKLEQKLGAGAMGVVYLGRHAMLRRPTAIKLLDVEKVNDASIRRFEQEVQITCQLNHPNTIAIYDYGRTPEGVFYYAMEYLDGLTLQQLVELHGPLPEGRVIHILQQVCGSLYEAHAKGLVHRDIKPANLMLNRRGGEADVVKVLDFGLVKAVDQDKQAAATSAGSLTGTPLYMSPEAIQSPLLVDACSDLYAVGAVGYFLLTGQPVFNAASVVELLQQHVSLPAVPPSQRLGRPVSEELEHALLACLEKNRARRPQTARILVEMLAKSAHAGTWSWDDADAWWSRYERGTLSNKAAATMTSVPVTERTMISDPDD